MGEVIDPQVRLFEGILDIIPHYDWFRTAVTIADKIAEKTERKYCWTHSVPDLNISCFGINHSDEIQHINIAFDTIGISNVSTEWIT